MQKKIKNVKKKILNKSNLNTNNIKFKCMYTNIIHSYVENISK